MAKGPRVVFDTNIFISAIIFGGNPRTCLELAREGEIQLLTSKAILLELAKKLQDKFKWNDAEILEVIEGIGKIAQIVIPKHKINLISDDPSDNRILECAEAAKVGYIISGDKKHLLSLGKFGKIPIVTVKQFLDNFYKKK